MTSATDALSTIPHHATLPPPSDLDAYHFDTGTQFSMDAVQYEDSRHHRDDGTPQPPPDLPGPDDQGHGPDAAPAGAPSGACVGAGAAAGAGVGGWAGFVAGAGAGAQGGGEVLAGAGTFIEPGGGTLVGGGIGAIGGAVVGGVVGAIAGHQVASTACPPAAPPHTHPMTETNGGGSSQETGFGGHAPGSRSPGKLTGDTSELNPHEKRFVDELIAEGHDVEVIPTNGGAAGKTPDLKIDGETYEVKTVSGAQGRDVDTLSGVVSNRIMRARGQSGNVIVDARGQAGMTKAAAERAIIRAQGAERTTGVEKLQKIVILTADGPVTWSR